MSLRVNAALRRADALNVEVRIMRPMCNTVPQALQRNEEMTPAHVLQENIVCSRPLTVVKIWLVVCTLVGIMRGRVVKPTAEKRAAEVLDGIVAYPDGNGVECFAAFGAHQVLQRMWWSACAQRMSYVRRS